MRNYIQADPYAFPFDRSLHAHNTALIIVDMQVDFCGEGGYIHQMNLDVSATEAVIQTIKNLLHEVRQIQGFTVVFTRLGFKPDLSNIATNRLWRSKQMKVGIGDRGPIGRNLILGEPGLEIVPDLAPIQGEILIDKPGLGSFYATDLDFILRNKGIKNLIITGVTTDVCVHTTMREANDIGYECLLLKDCTRATVHANYLATLDMTTMQHGLFGTVSDSQSVIEALKENC
jgi:nicotinamidase-related amidase